MNYPLNSNFGAYHKDVMGQWFTAKATGTIDTVFWEQWIAVNSYDSTIYLCIHKSNIGATYGPGIRPGPFNPPCQNWGYWVNTDDADQGVAAFIEEATDPTWVSTINGSPTPSGPPFSTEIWGFGGVAVNVHAAQLNFYDLGVLGVRRSRSATASSRSGELQSCRHPWRAPREFDEGRTEWGAAGFSVSTADEDYPARDWKFYERQGSVELRGRPARQHPPRMGQSRGFTGDTLDVAVWNWWYAMTVSPMFPDHRRPDQPPYHVQHRPAGGPGDHHRL